MQDLNFTQSSSSCCCFFSFSPSSFYNLCVWWYHCQVCSDDELDCFLKNSFEVFSSVQYSLGFKVYLVCQYIFLGLLNRGQSYRTCSASLFSSHAWSDEAVRQSLCMCTFSVLSWGEVCRSDPASSERDNHH